MTYYQDEDVTLHHGGALDVARTLEGGSVDCIVTSPPYYQLRDYGQAGQYGRELTPADYVTSMAGVFRELRRTLAEDGTLWLNLGDAYGKGKQLMGVPWRVALALQDDGWILRNSIVWHKPNAMPESVKDRLGGRHENLFLFAKSQKYFFDLDAIREPYADVSLGRAGRARVTSYDAPGQTPNKRAETAPHPGGKNPGDVWSINTRPFKGAHFAVFPPALAERAVLAGCKPGGTVLDPFSGSGTTGMVALEHGLKYVGIDVSAEYLDLSLATRLDRPARKSA